MMDVLQPRKPPKIYICHSDFEHDRTYTENVVRYLESQGVQWRSIPLTSQADRAELQLCLDDAPTAVLGYNSQLDHAWLSSSSFLEMAARRGIRVLQWILDHPATRWREFQVSTAANSCFLLNTKHLQDYFATYCLPSAVTATMGGVGPNSRSRVTSLCRQDFMRRPVACLIAISLARLWSVAENESRICALDPQLAEVARDVIARARDDLTGPLQAHVTAALAAASRWVPLSLFNEIAAVSEHGVQAYRRLKIFAVARRYPVLVQSDETAAPFVSGASATFATNVGMQLTLAKMPLCRAIVSLSPVNDMIHDRTMNALNAGCVVIAEANAAHKAVFTHGVNALLFRYDDDSFAACLDIVCNHPERAYAIAQAGMKLRDDPRLHFGEFRNLIDLALRPL